MSLKIWTASFGVLLIALVVQIVLNIQVAVEIIRSGRSTGNPQNAKHKNIAKTVIILTLILFLTVFPYFLLKLLEFLVRQGYFSSDKTAVVMYYLSYCHAPIAMLNFAANPILYALRLPDYRKTLLAFVGKTRSRFPRPINAEQVVTVNKHVLLEKSKRKSVDYV
ncbi:dopamine D2-like receptor isoform X1 [Paramuricea clavata]|nr:dopamine D2-like receptor isoform X1 [Paramuricea clavata]